MHEDGFARAAPGVQPCAPLTQRAVTAVCASCSVRHARAATAPGVGAPPCAEGFAVPYPRTAPVRSRGHPPHLLRTTRCDCVRVICLRQEEGDAGAGARGVAGVAGTEARRARTRTAATSAAAPAAAARATASKAAKSTGVRVQVPSAPAHPPVCVRARV